MLRRSFLLALTGAAVAGPALASESRRSTGGESYLPFTVLTANVRRPNGRMGVLTCDVGLDVPDAALRERASLLQPRLRAEFVAILQRGASGLRPGEPPNPDQMSRQFQQAVDQTLGRPGARVLLGTILVN